MQKLLFITLSLLCFSAVNADQFENYLVQEVENLEVCASYWENCIENTLDLEEYCTIKGELKQSRKILAGYRLFLENQED